MGRWGCQTIDGHGSSYWDILALTAAESYYHLVFSSPPSFRSSLWPAVDCLAGLERKNYRSQKIPFHSSRIQISSSHSSGPFHPTYLPHHLPASLDMAHPSSPRHILSSYPSAYRLADLFFQAPSRFKIDRRRLAGRRYNDRFHYLTFRNYA